VRRSQFDAGACATGFAAALDRRSGSLRITGVTGAPVLPCLGFLTHDLLGVERAGERAAVGPFAKMADGCYRIAPPETGGPAPGGEEK
jgi:hypothetical protein